MPDKQQQPAQKKTQDNKGRSLSRRSAEQVPADALMALQSSIGNAALGKMLGARDRAAEEGPTRVDPGTQGAIDAKQGGGEALEPGMQEQMQGIAGEDLSGVRVHHDPESDALARGLGATALTQGRDVFLRSDRDPASEPGRNTLAHELSHVAQGSVGPGAVLREPATDTPPAPGSPQAEYAASQNNFMAPQPNMLMTGGAAPTAGAAPAAAGPAGPGAASGPAPAAASGTADPKNLAPRNLLPGLGAPMEGLMYEAPPQEPASSAAPKSGGDHYDIEYTMYGKPEVFKDQDDEGVIHHLDNFGFSVMGDMRMGRQWQESWIKENGESFSSRWTAAAASIAGGADWPDLSEWGKVTATIAEAMQMVRESRWAVLAAKGDSGLDEGARKAAVPLNEQRILDIVALLEKADRDGDKAWNNWVGFLKDTEKGASRTITGLKVAKVAGAIAATYLTGGAAAELELGFWGTSAALGVGAGTYGAAQELGNQAGMVWFAGQDSIHWGDVAKAGAVNAAAGFVGGAIGGKFAGMLGNSLGKMIGGLSPEVMETFGIEGAELLTNGEKIFVNWLGGVASSPFVTSTTVLMQSALDQKWTVTSVGDFFDLILGDMVKNGTIGAFFSYAHANGAGKPGTVSESTTGGGGGGEPGGGGGGGGGGGAGDTQLGMGAAGPAGEGAGPRSTAGDTQLGMGAAGPAGENAGPRSTAGDTQTGMGAAGPAGENATPVEDTTSDNGGGRDTEQGMGAAGPAAAAEPVHVINDVAEAQAAQADAEANGDRYRWPRDPDVVRDLWVREAGQDPNTDPPAAWTGPDGLVVNGAIVPVEAVPSAQVSAGQVLPGRVIPADAVPNAGQTQMGMGAAGPVGENAPPGTTGGGGGGGGGGAGGGAGQTQLGMGAAGPAGENAPPATRTGNTQQGMGVVGPEDATAPGDTVPDMTVPDFEQEENTSSPTEETTAVSEPVRRFSETSELEGTIDRESRMGVSGYESSLPPGYGTYRSQVRLSSGEVVEAVIKIYPADKAADFAKDMENTRAASFIPRAPEFYGQVEVPAGPEARPGSTDLAFAMEVKEGAFPDEGVDRADPRYEQAAREASAARSRITDQTIDDIRSFGNEILDKGYYYGGNQAGEVQGLIGPDGEWSPIDFQGLNPLPPETNPDAVSEALREHEAWIQDEVDRMEKRRVEFENEDPTSPEMSLP